MRHLSIFFIILLNTICLSAQKNIPPEKPKLIIAIVVDMMRYDYVERYWNKFGKGGFRRLINEGANCRNANYNYIFTQTGPGHATIFTGTEPANHGIVTNYWYLRLKKTGQYCVADNNVKTVGSDSEAGQCSPVQLNTSTIGDEIKLANNSRSKVIGIAIKDRAAILPAGHTADAAYWYDGKTGNWITSTYYLDSLPLWVTDFNEKKYPDIYLAREWNTLLPIEEYTESLPDSSIYEKGFANRQITFPYNLDEISSTSRNSRDYSILKYTPYGNTYTNDFAIAAIVNEELGKDEITDMLTVSYSVPDYIGHAYGPASVETEDIYLRLDREIEHLLTFVDETLGKKEVLIVLTSDHGVAHIPEYLADIGIPAGKFKHNLALALLKSYLNAIYGEGEWVSTYSQQQIYLNHQLIEDSKIPLAEIQTKVANFLIQFSGIENTATSTTMQTVNFTDGIFDKMQNSYNQKRSGDVIINLSPGFTEDITSATTHNTAYNYDTHVPLIWYGWKINRSSIYKSISTTDIAPTISLLLNIPFPNGATGKPIVEIIE